VTNARPEGGATDNGRPALARCLSVPADEFAAEYWGVRPLLSTAAELPDGFEDLLDAASVDELVSQRGLRTPFLRMALKGRVLNTGSFTRTGGLGASIGDQVADDKLQMLFAGGATLVLQGLHRIWPPLMGLAQQLSSDLGHPVQINAYVTPADNRGFDAHYDVHDVFVLQIAGRKRWRIHEPVFQAPLSNQPWTDHRSAVSTRAQEEPVIDAVLSPGDALYLPRGWLHSAEALGETTIHITVGVAATTRYDVLRHLIELAADSPELRAALPLGVDPDEPDRLKVDLDAIVAGLADRLARTTVDDAADAVRSRIGSTTRPEPLAPLAQIEALNRLTVDSRVRLRRHSHAWVEDGVQDDGAPTVWLRSNAGEINVPPRHRPVLEALLDGEAHRVGDLTGSEDEASIGVVHLLMTDGLVVPA
jgi:ribosomal protein L16 Arg81 hydroxylase